MIQDVGRSEMNVDWIKVSRVAHQIELDHERNGYLDAERRAIDAAAKGFIEESEFWRAVASAIRPRSESPNSQFDTDTSGACQPSRYA